MNRRHTIISRLFPTFMQYSTWEKSLMTDRQFNARSHIVSVLIEMMKTTAFDKIKITDLCKHAGISREAFYSYFYDRYDAAFWFCEKIHAKVYPIDGIGYDLFTSCCLMNQEQMKNAVFYKNAYKSNDLNAIHYREIFTLENLMTQKVKKYISSDTLSKKHMFQCHHSAILIITSTREWTLADFPTAPEEFAEFQCSMIPEIIQNAYSYKLPQKSDS